MPDDVTIALSQLRVGLYIELDLKWFEHPFAFNRFKIKNPEQIHTLRSLGLKHVRYVAELSDVEPLSLATSAPQETPAEPAEVSPAVLAKRAMMERLHAHREAAARIETAFVDSAKAIRDIEKNLFAQPEETVQKASRLVTHITDSILCTPELAIHVMGDTLGSEEVYFHSLNVAMLSMMMGRELKLPQEIINVLGMGALFHDIGFEDIPDKIFNKLEPLTAPEQNLYELHPHYGEVIAQRLHFQPAIATIIAQHHEFFDGSGYPNKLKGDAIGLLSRIVAIANNYDELCNPVNIANAVTPHEALSTMFARQRGKFDPKLLQVFIRCMGVYPPGTVVELVNGMVGMVATVNSANPMKPVLVMYDVSIPRHEALMLDMERETDLNIGKALRPAHVPPHVYAYLSPRKRVSYYFDATA